MILCANPKMQYFKYSKDINSAVHAVFESGFYVNGPQVSSFESDFAKFVGVPYAIGVANGTDAIELALRAFDIGQGDEVITVSHTASATVSAIERAGATPVLLDVDPKTYTIDVGLLDKALTSKTKAVVAVHLYGHPAKVDELKKFCSQNNLKFIEDCAQSHGAKYNGQNIGSLGDIACFSFYPTKNLGAIGDGGAIVVKSQDVYNKIMQIREYGWKDKYISIRQGVNSRLDEVQAAILKVKLPYLNEMNIRRQEIAKMYTKELASLPITLPSVENGSEHVFHLFVIRLKDKAVRDGLKNFLYERKVHCLIHYPVPIHDQPNYLNKVRTVGDMRVTKAASEEILSLPMYPELTNEEVYKVIELIKAYPF